MQGNERDSDDRTLSELYSELSQEQPSTALDEKILSEAHKAVAPKRATSPFSGTWMVPTSIAAVIVLSVIVVTTIERKAPDAITSFPEPAAKQKEDMSGRQVSGLAVTEEKPPAAMLKSQVTEPVIDSDSIESRSTVKDNAVSAQPRSSISAAPKREKKKARVALAKPVPSPSRLANEPNVIRDQEASLGTMTKESESEQLESIAPEEDMEVESSIQQKQTLEFADDYRARNELTESQAQSEIVAQKAESDIVQHVAKSRNVESAGFSAPQAIVKQPRKGDVAASCSSLSELDCLKSSNCILQQTEKDSGYQCRAADNSCELEFIQSFHQKSDCEAKKGCKYVPANCYCEPIKLCVCGGGTPAQCVTDKEDASR